MVGLRTDLERRRKAVHDQMLSTGSDKLTEEDRLLWGVLEETQPGVSAA